MSTARLKMVGIGKSFPGVKALAGVDIEVGQGEILALLGENGAGKSTLMKVLVGVHQPDCGEIFIDGQLVIIQNPRQAQELGISIIYQEFNLIPFLSVAENIFLGREPRVIKGVVNWKKLYAQTTELLERVGLRHISPKSLVNELSIAEQQLVEVSKALSYATKIIVMDEPTAALNEEDTRRLINIMVGLKEQGMAIIFITHRLEEVGRVADRVTVLRDGRFIGSAAAQELSKDDIVRMMVGRDINDLYPERKDKLGGTVLEVAGLNFYDHLKDVSFCLSKGEVLGVGGLMGSGSEYLAKALFGVYPKIQGTVSVEGGKPISTIREAIDSGLALVTDDRKGLGLVLSMSVGKNILMPTYRHLAKLGVLVNRAKHTDIIRKWIEKLKIKVHSSSVEVVTLSGGNQQKVVLAKWLEMNPKVLILQEPTRGIDVGAKGEIYQMMKNLTDEGKSIILISSEMPELLGMSHRILVMHDGRITAELLNEEATQEKIFIYATGGEVG